MAQLNPAVAERGALRIFDTAQQLLDRAVAQRGVRAGFSFPDTAYYLPIALGWAGQAVAKLGDLQEVIDKARQAASSDVSTFLAAEAIQALRSADGCFNTPITDTQVRTWGVQLAEGRIPGVAVVIGGARSSAAARDIIEALRRDNFLCMLSGNTTGASVVDQLKEDGMDLAGSKPLVELGPDPISAVHAFGFIARLAMQLGGLRPGSWPAIAGFARQRVPGFILLLGEVEDQSRALSQAAECFDFPIVYGAADNAAETAEHLIQRCLAARGIQPAQFHVDIPVAYGPAYEDELIDYHEFRWQFGGGDRTAFQLLQVVPADEITDGNVAFIGTNPPQRALPAHLDLGVLVRVAGHRLQPDFEPYLEKQISSFINYARGVRHTGSQEAVCIRISSDAAERGFGLRAVGEILCKRFHEEFSETVEKVEVVFVLAPKEHAELYQKALASYASRARRLASISDTDVEEFYTCGRCRAFLPDDICIVSPERSSSCGGCNWLEAKATYELHPGGFRHPIRLGRLLDAKKGVWEGTNAYVHAASGGRTTQVSLYSIMENPMGACGTFECIVMLIPEANGVMVVAQDGTSRTPAGLDVKALAGMAAGDQTPGLMAIGRNYLLSRRFIAAEGGFQRVVWMSSSLKTAMEADLARVCEREGVPGFMAKVADERHATTVNELVRWLKEHDHPALQMEKMY